MSDYYLEIILKNKIYSQRTPNSKVIEFNLNGVKQKSYDELPKDIKEIIDEIKDMEENPEKYFTYKFVDDTVRITNIKKFNTPFLKIPDTIHNCPVTHINMDLETKQNLKNIIQIQLPKHLKVLPDFAFKNLYELKYIILPKDLKEIPNSCCERCRSLEYINLENIEYIGSSAFESCVSLKSIILKNINKLKPKCFSGCIKLKTAIIEGTINTIEKSAFENCVKLQEAILPDTIEKIEEAAFCNCNLNVFTAPKNLDSIGLDAFFGNDLNEVILNEKLSKIGNTAFEMNKFKTVKLSPNTIIKDDTFDENVSIIPIEKDDLER